MSSIILVNSHIGLKLQFFSSGNSKHSALMEDVQNILQKMVVNATGSLIVVYNKVTLYYHHLYYYFIIFYAARQPSDDYFIIATFYNYTY